MKTLLTIATILTVLTLLALCKQYDDAHIGQYRIDAQASLDARCARMTPDHKLPICEHNFIIDDEHKIEQ